MYPYVETEAEEAPDDSIQAENVSEAGPPPSLRTMEDPPRRVNRREIDARRYNGKEDVEEYLLQFQLTARRNGWDENEKAAAILCALDGPARGILTEFDDPVSANFADIKKALLRRFGPTQLLEVHEQSLSQLRLAKGQNIRELTHEVQRLTKLAYPDVTGNTRDRLTVKHLLNALPDRDAIFYIREKNPGNVAEACTLYERYQALTGDDGHHRRTGIRGVNQDPTREPPARNPDPVSEALQKFTDTTTHQLKKLTDAMAQLSSKVTSPPQPTVTPPAPTPPGPPSSAPVPRKPCPRCGQVGHWARDCPAPSQPTPPANSCYRCGQQGHFSRQCPMSLNTYGPMPAPSTGPRQPLRQ